MRNANRTEGTLVSWVQGVTLNIGSPRYFPGKVVFGMQKYLEASFRKPSENIYFN